MQNNYTISMTIGPTVDPITPADNLTNATYDVLLEANSIVTALSSFAFLFISTLLIFYHCGGRVGGFNSPNNLVLLFFGTISVTITPLSVCNSNNGIYSWYVIVTLATIGIIVYMVGCTIFFEVSNTDKPLCYRHPDVSLILWVVAIPLVLLELFETISALKTQQNIDYYFVGVNTVGLLQKLLQASFYHFNLRLKVARQGRKKGAGWFLITISLFNYAMWLDSIMRANAGTKYIEVVFGKGFSIVTTACSALLIDYRLLCCLLFAEHALDVQSEINREIKEEENTTVIDEEEPKMHDEWNNSDDVASLSSIGSIGASTNSFIATATQMSGFGYLFGFTCVSLQLVCGLQYANLVGHWANAFPIFADVSVIFLGILFVITSATPEELGVDNNWRETHSKAIDVMVAIMGVVGFLFWVIKSGLNVTWTTMTNRFAAERLDYLHWSAAKNSFRTIGILFQLYIFMKSDPLIDCRFEVRNNALNFFLLPALMLSLLSVFTMTVIDSYSGFIEVLIENSGLNVVLSTLLKAGEPIHLGFCLHVFLHFFIINQNMRNFKKSKEIQRLFWRSRPQSKESRPYTPKNHRRGNRVDEDISPRLLGNQDNDALTEPLLQAHED